MIYWVGFIFINICLYRFFYYLFLSCSELSLHCNHNFVKVTVIFLQSELLVQFLLSSTLSDPYNNLFKIENLRVAISFVIIILLYHIIDNIFKIHLKCIYFEWNYSDILRL